MKRKGQGDEGTQDHRRGTVWNWVCGNICGNFGDGAAHGSKRPASAGAILLRNAVGESDRQRHQWRNDLRVASLLRSAAVRHRDDGGGMAILLHRTRRRPVRHNTPSSYSRPASAPAPKPVWPEEDADWSAWKPRETRTNPFAGAIYEELPSRAPSPAVPSAYTPPPILPPSNAADEPSPYARPFEEAPTPPPAANPPVPPVAAPPAPEASEPSAAETPYAAPDVLEPAAETVPPPAPKLSASSSTPPVAPARAEAGTPSQSGSRVMIRSTIASKAEKPVPEPASPAPAQASSRKVVLDGIAYEPNEPPEEEATPPVSSRIRSTMGKHTV